MPLNCVAGHCNNNTDTKGISLHLFPKDQHLNRQWINFVKTKRSDFSKPSKYSRLCSGHFRQDDYENYTRLRLGFATRGILNPKAVPTIHGCHPKPGSPRKLAEAGPRSLRQPSAHNLTNIRRRRLVEDLGVCLLFYPLLLLYIFFFCTTTSTVLVIIGLLTLRYACRKVLLLGSLNKMIMKLETRH